jgi:hypothetical protein
MARVKSYDKLSLTDIIVLDLPHFEGEGLVVNDVSRYHHYMGLTNNPVWTQLVSGQQVLDYNGVNQYLQCPSANSINLNITSEDFTLMAWINENTGAAGEIMVQGAVDVDGWEFYVFGNTIALRTNQLGSHTGISTIGYTPGVWTLVAVTRHGSTGQFYINGVPVATTLGTGLIDPVSCAGGNKLLIGCQNNEITNMLNGMMSHHRIWKRALLAGEIADIFGKERALYGV